MLRTAPSFLSFFSRFFFAPGCPDSSKISQVDWHSSVLPPAAFSRQRAAGNRDCLFGIFRLSTKTGLSKYQAWNSPNDDSYSSTSFSRLQTRSFRMLAVLENSALHSHIVVFTGRWNVCRVSARDFPRNFTRNFRRLFECFLNLYSLPRTSYGASSTKTGATRFFYLAGSPLRSRSFGK